MVGCSGTKVAMEYGLTVRAMRTNSEGGAACSRRPCRPGSESQSRPSSHAMVGGG